MDLPSYRDAKTHLKAPTQDELYSVTKYSAVDKKKKKLLEDALMIAFVSLFYRVQKRKWRDCVRKHQARLQLQEEEKKKKARIKMATFRRKLKEKRKEEAKASEELETMQTALKIVQNLKFELDKQIGGELM